jgi:hypothetical protein
MPFDIFTVGAGCLTWIPVAIMVVSLVGWMIGGELDVITGLVGLAAAIGLGFVAMRPLVPIHAPIALFIAIATVVVYPFLRATMRVRELRSFEVDELERAYEFLGQQPGNPLPKFRIARQVFELGMPGHAMKIAEPLMAQLPQNLFHEEHRLFRQWKYNEKLNATMQPISCSECGHRNEAGRTHCFQCGAAHLLNRFRGKILPGGQGKKILAAWTALVLLLLGIPAAGNLPMGAAVMLVIACLGLAGLSLYLAFRENPNRAAA